MMTVKELTKWYKLSIMASGYNEGFKDDMDDFVTVHQLSSYEWDKKYPNKHQVQSLMGHIVNTFNAVFDNDSATDGDRYDCWLCVCGVLKMIVDKEHVDIQAVVDELEIEKLWEKYKKTEVASAS